MESTPVTPGMQHISFLQESPKRENSEYAVMLYKVIKKAPCF